MLIRSTPPFPIAPSEITPEAVHADRRQFLARLGLAGAGLALTGCGDDAFEIETRVMAAIGRATPAPDYLAALARRQDHTRALAASHER